MMKIKIKFPSETSDVCDFQKGQPEPPAEKKPGEFSCRLAARSSEESADTGEKNKIGRAEMREPAREKKRRRGLRQIEWIELDVRKKIARVVESHQHHD